jgi:dihydropteroate synthase-like protein
MSRQHIQFVTGRLAEPAVRANVAVAAEIVGFDYTIDVLGISVAALMTPQWIARRVARVDAATKVMIPGYCRGELAPIAEATGVPAVRGPKDIRELSDHLGHPRRENASYGKYTIEIIAEINHASSLATEALLAEADRLRRDGADVIDVGCDPGEKWSGVAEAVRALRQTGHRVSIDTMDPKLIIPAVKAGAELVLSVNTTNREAAADWGCEVVAIPDMPDGPDAADKFDTLAATIAFLDGHHVPYRIDPILEPIGFGFAASLSRFAAVRQRWPDARVMMGIGNLTELTDVDSAGVNVLLLAFCEELGIGSVLTTEVINWARTSVRECDVARRLVHHAITQRTLPKHLDPRLVMLRDVRVIANSTEEIATLAAGIKDRNYRVLTAKGELQGDAELHVVNGDGHHRGHDPFAIFAEIEASASRPIDASHGFYLGYEMAKAMTALTLGKTYRQDEALDWGMLTRDEHGHRHDRRERNAEPDGPTERNRDES